MTSSSPLTFAASCAFVCTAVCAGACGAAPAGGTFTVTLEEKNADGTPSAPVGDSGQEHVESLTSAAVTLVPDAQRLFGEVDRATLLDVELITPSQQHAHVVIRDSAARKHVDIPENAALKLTMEGPCCIGPQLSSAILVDDDGILAAGVESGGIGGAVADTALTMSSAGATELPQIGCFGDDYTIAVRIAGDDPGAAVTLRGGESAGVKALGHVVDVHDAGSFHQDTSATDSIVGDHMSWSAARIE